MPEPFADTQIKPRFGEPWTVEDAEAGVYVKTKNGDRVAKILGDVDIAHRICDCVNAEAGMTAEDLSFMVRMHHDYHLPYASTAYCKGMLELQGFTVTPPSSMAVAELSAERMDADRVVVEPGEFQ